MKHDPAQHDYPIDHESICLAFANALNFLLKEREGIVAQGEDGNNAMHKFIVFRADGKIRAQLADGLDKEVGTMFFIHRTAQDTIVAAAETGGEFVIDDYELGYEE